MPGRVRPAEELRVTAEQLTHKVREVRRVHQLADALAARTRDSLCGSAAPALQECVTSCGYRQLAPSDRADFRYLPYLSVSIATPAAREY